MALFLVLVQIFVLALIVAALGSLAIRNLRATSEKSWERQARFAAYAGIQNSLAELNADAGFESTTPLERPLSEDGFLRYTFEVRNNVESGDGSAVLAPDNTWIPPGAAWVRSKGYLAEVGSYETSALIALVSRARPVFDHAIFAEEQLRIDSSSVVRSYSSAEGFDSTASQPGSPKYQAHLGTNSTQAGAIHLASGAWVDGNAYSGLGSAPGAVISGTSSLAGSSLQLDEEKQVFRFRTDINGSNRWFQIPEPNRAGWLFPWETDSEPTRGNVDLPREEAYTRFVIRVNNPNWRRATNLFAGEYRVDDDLRFFSDFTSFVESRVHGPTQIPVHANDEFPVIFYVAGDVNLDNVLVNHLGVDGNDPVPRRLQFYMLTPGSTFRVTNDSVVHAVVAGKGVNVVVEGNSKLFGAVIASSVTVNSSEVNYDTTLAGVPLDGRTAWDILALKEASVGEATQTVGDAGATEGPPPSVHTLAQHPQRGTRAAGASAALPPGGITPEIIPRELIEPPPAPPPPIPGPPGDPGPGDPGPGDPGPGDPGEGICGTCGGLGGPRGGGPTCGAPSCPGHIPCGECNLSSQCVPMSCGGCGGYYPGDGNDCPGGFAHAI